MQDFTMMEVDIDLLMHHPANPRKDLGDLTELTDSIKAQGIMQNLTVIPTHYYADHWDRSREGELLRIVERFKNGEKLTRDSKLYFYVLIGNRRFEAAKAAGLEKVPCRIVTGLSKDEQVSIMLLENIQRNDLTITEQAQGFQMMIDLGDSVDGIVKKTGFSQATVYHRLNIAKLDQDIVEEKLENKQINITELMELEKIPDVEKRNEILKKRSNIHWAVEEELRKIEKEEKKQKLLSIIRKDFIIDLPPENERLYQKPWVRVCNISLNEEPDLSQLPKEELVYDVGWDYITIYYKSDEVEPEETEEEDEEQKEQARKKKHLNELNEELHGKVEQFVFQTIEDKVHFRMKADECFKACWNFVLDHCMDAFDSGAMDNIEDFLIGHYDKPNDESEDLEDEDDFTLMIKDKAAELYYDKQAIVMIVSELLTYGSMIANYRGEYVRHTGDRWGGFIEILKRYYKFEIEEELQKFVDGEHEDFMGVVG